MKKIVSILMFALAVLFMSSTVFAGTSTKVSGPAFLTLDDTQHALVLSDDMQGDDDDKEKEDDEDDQDKHH